MIAPAHPTHQAIFENIPINTAAVAEAFLRDIYGSTDGNLMIGCVDPARFDHVKKKSPFDAYWFKPSARRLAADKAADLTRRGCNVYYGVGLHGKPAGPGKRGDAAAVAMLPGIFADIDILDPAHKKANLPPTIADAMDLLATITVAPSVLVHSGHGLQALWLFEEMLRTDTPEGRERADNLLKLFKRKLQGEAAVFGWAVDAVQDLARVLRLPGTMNVKGEPVPVKIIEQSGNRYTLDQLETAIRWEEPTPVLTPPQNAGDAAEKDVAQRQPSGRTPTVVVDDATLLKVASNTRKGGGDFSALWRGSTAAQAGDASAADMSLTNRLAYFAGPDERRIDQLFRRSGLYRPKWDEKHFSDGRTYGQATIAAALKGRWEYFDWNAWKERATRKEERAQRQHAKAQAVRTEWKPEQLTQRDNALRLVEVLDGNARFNTDRSEWEWYDGRRFSPDAKGRVPECAKRVSRECLQFLDEQPDGVDYKTAARHFFNSSSASGITAMAKLAESHPGIPISIKEFDADPMLLNVLNGTVDLRSGELRPHRREDLITKLAPVEFDPEAECPTWDSFLDRIMAGNEALIGYLQRIAGLCLTGDASVQELWILHGGGANGKSVFTDTLAAMVGDYGGTAAPTLLTSHGHDTHPTEIADLVGRRLVFASETEESARLRIQLVKRLTGDSILKGRFMRQDFFEFPRTHKLLLVTNNCPQIRETTNAIWRRVRLVPFNVTIPQNEQDPRLLAKLKAEWSGILNWAVAGCLEWQRTGMRPPTEVELATEEYQADQDTLSEFLTEKCATGAVFKVPRSEIFAAYQTWAKSNGDTNSMDRTAFYGRLRKVPDVEETMVRIGGQPTRVFTGIGLMATATAYGQSFDD